MVDVMWRSFNLIGRAEELRMKTSKLVDWEEQFWTTHTVYEPSSSLVFYRCTVDWTSVSFVLRPSVRIKHDGKPILLAQDLLSREEPVGERWVKRTGDEEIELPGKQMKESSEFLGPQRNPTHSRKATPVQK
ncbi:hypothetical protein DFH08DRAFT_798738 [Mycena albidolilacea]|uniref:Uncharacterized protein n=1 Tax=Mycena albidolilacea TaxID=1033008 RepID=A0AAD7AP32_9AGAR|nr:hypothetical protein DFH08DRAFT_798738 [Mycena albidolilacea]